MGGNTLGETKKRAFSGGQERRNFCFGCFYLGLFFIRWVFFSWEGWGVTAFTLGYSAVVTRYFLKKGIHITRAGWFWLAVVVLTGVSFSLWSNKGLEPWRSICLFLSAVYWVINVTGLPLLGKTSNWLILDGINGLFVIPFRNFGCQYQSIAFLGRDRRAEGRKIFSIVLGLLLTLIVVSMVLPLLMKADSGGFAKITGGVTAYFYGMGQDLAQLIFHGILAIPVAAYLFGLVAGSAHKRGWDAFQVEGVEQALSALRVLPLATVYTLLGLLCTLYVVFLGSQAPYFFSPFVGERPEGWQVYSEYARSGFFELCRIAAINLSVLAGANIFSKKTGRGGLVLKVLNSLLAVLTLVLIATALSKMAMYIGAYGLSVRRLLPCLFMVFLAVICGGIVALQKWQFSIVRLALGVGVVMLCTLSLADPDSFVARYNADRYLSGTLQDFDAAILYRSGPAGVDPALKVYEKTDDPVLKDALKAYLLTQRELAAESLGKPGDNLQKVRARQKTTEI
ncbi:DUF4153 domain-containing protein [Dehalobacterium formicoaceticum]|uniref:DUF4153 domain-containing protein n=1 Tax=Dehalobacterium formicoaceticum TaxID=51515 RepID=UPI000B7CEFE5|nr:DUF4173 domain-containing protein [Dehalobacterium formicoaceticum]